MIVSEPAQEVFVGAFNTRFLMIAILTPVIVKLVTKPVMILVFRRVMIPVIKHAMTNAERTTTFRVM